MPFEIENAQIVISLGTFIGMGFTLWKILYTISSFTNRVDNMEESHKVLNERVMRMELRHEANEQKINEIHVGLARLEGKIDFLRKEVK